MEAGLDQLFSSFRALCHTLEEYNLTSILDAISWPRMTPTPFKTTSSSALSRFNTRMRLLTWDKSGYISFTQDLVEHELPQYAILSHTWGAENEEVTFQDILNGKAVEKLGYTKIKFCVQQAERDGLQHCWVDSTRAHDLKSSRWFRRGWTLQELLAPRNIVFFASTGEQLGSKLSLEQDISAATRIPVAALHSTSLVDFSTTERFLWQEGRETTVPEDLAYSLLGVFGVSMSIIYGEGYFAARQRLEEEISKTHKGKVHNFIGRTQELNIIKDALHSNGSRRYVTVHGCGGMGKTQLALEYVTRFRHMYSAILWLNSDTRDTLQTSYMKIAEHMLSQPVGNTLGITKSDTNADLIVEKIKNWLSQPENTRWLMIFDNYDNPMMLGNKSPSRVNIENFFPTAHQGSIIVTTRSGDVRLGYILRLTKFERVDESIGLLLTTSSRTRLAEDPYASQLIQELDGLPLALATAGAYLSQSSMSLDRYVHLYKRSWAKLQQTSIKLSTYDRNLYSTWQVTFDQIKDKYPAAANFLRLSAYFGNEDIWLELLQHYNDDDPTWIVELTHDELDFEVAVQTLCRYGLLERTDTTAPQNESRGYSMHKCVHSWARSVLEVEKEMALANYALRCVAGHVPKQDEKNWWLTQRRLLNHASVCREVIANSRSNQLASAPWVWQNLGNLYCDQEKLAEAKQLYEQALGGSEKTQGEAHNSILNTIYNLGILYRKQGKLAEAEEMYMRALGGFEEALGAEHIMTLKTLYNLSLLYYIQGRLAEAEKIGMRTFVGHEKTLGAEHTGTINTVHNLGIIYKHQGKLATAEEMYVRALVGYEKTLGAEHTSTLNSVGNLAQLYLDQGKLAEAEKMIMRVLSGYEKALGAEYTQTLNSVNTLGVIYREQGRLTEAEKMHIRALAGFVKTVGAEHSLTLKTVRNLGELYYHQGKLAQAEERCLQALTGFTKVLGSEHISTLETLNILGLLYCRQGKLAQAEEMHKQALIGLQKALGPEHASTLETLNGLGIVYRKQGKLSEAEQLQAKVMHKRRTLFGEDHPSTLKSMHDLSLTYLKLGNLEESQRLVILSYKARIHVLGPDHPLTHESMTLMTVIASKMGVTGVDDVVRE